MTFAIELTIFARRAVAAHTKVLSKAQLKLFVEHISQDVLTGLHSEIFRKCDAFLRDGAVARVTVELPDQQVVCDLTSGGDYSGAAHFKEFIYFDEAKSRVAGTVTLIPRLIPFAQLFTSAFEFSLGIALLSALLLGIAMLGAFLLILRSFQRVVDGLSTMKVITLESIDQIRERTHLFQLKEERLLLHRFRGLAEQLIEQQGILAEARQKSAQADFAAQVSHDIRSPVSALNLVAGTLSEVAEDKRLIITSATQRINDIANELLKKSRNVIRSDKAPTVQEDVVMLSVLLDRMATEKRMQYRHRSNLEIRVIESLETEHFVRSKPGELARVISNLIDNSVEAMPKGGLIQVTTQIFATDVSIVIQDDGVGIPQRILGKIGAKGFSFGKAGSSAGSGLGVYHAIETIESFGGSVKIESIEGAGTTIRLILPRVQAPKWFASELVFDNQTIIISVDDDPAIHGVWRQRFKEPEFVSAVRAFASVEDFEEAFALGLPSQCLYLIDQEFLGRRVTGLDVIERYGLAERAILVTSRFEDEDVRSRAEHLNVKILPKSWAPFVKLQGSCLHKASSSTSI